MSLKHVVKPVSPLILITLLLAACAGSGDYDATKNWSAKRFYDDASTALANGEYQTAIKDLESLEARFPFDHYAKQAELDIAYAYYKDDEPDSAISAANRFIRLHPRDPHIDYAYYLKGLINFNRGRGILDKWVPRDPAKYDSDVLKNSFNDFATLVRRFPQSRYAGDAYQRMIYLRNMLAKKDIEIAEYYVKRGIWIAAANRAKNVIEQYQQSIWTPRALAIMELSYKKLGLKDLASDTQRIIMLNQHGPKPKDVEADQIQNDPKVPPPKVVNKS